MRKWVRHPSSIPIEFSVTRPGQFAADSPRLRDISQGGFCCAIAEPLPVGAAVQLRIPSIWPDYSGNGTVMWCRDTGNSYEAGIAFSTQDSFRTKMVEQLCQIEQYRQRAWADEGRHIDSQQAAEEWIALFADEFARTFQPLSLRR